MLIHFPTLVTLLSPFFMTVQNGTDIPAATKFQPVLTEFEYYSRDRGVDVSTHRTSYNSSVYLVFYIHGFNEDEIENFNIEFQRVKSVLFNKYPKLSTVVLVNWKGFSDIRNYQSILNTYGAKIAESVGEELQKLFADSGHALKSDSIGIIGQGIGANIAVLAARNFKRSGSELKFILGLNPLNASTRPLSELVPRPEDAEFLTVIQTETAGLKCDRDSIAHFWDDISCQRKTATDLLITGLNNSRAKWPPGIGAGVPLRIQSAVTLLLLDVSPGMQAENRLQRLIKISRHFVKVVPFHSFLGIDFYGGSAKVIQLPIEIQDEGVRQTVLEKLPTKRTQIPGTSVVSALQDALKISKTFLEAGSCPEIFIITDGEEGKPAISSFYPKLKPACVRVNVIQIGKRESVQNSFQNLSDYTNGNFIKFNSENTTELQGFLYRLVDSSSRTLPPNFRQIHLPSKTFRANQSVEYIFDHGIGHNTRLVINSHAYDQIVIRVTDPNGRLIKSTSENVDADLNAMIFNMANAVPGKWKIGLMQNEHGLSEHATISVTTMANSPEESTPVVRLEAKVSTTVINYTAGIPVSIHAKVSQGADHRVIGANVFANILSEGTRLHSINLLDNGAGADAVKNDGIYTAFITQPLKQGTNYHVTVTATSRNITKIRRITKEDPYLTVPLDKVHLKIVSDFERHVRVGSIKAVGSYKRFRPGRVRDLEARRLVEQEYETTSPIRCELTWTASGQEADVGSATSFEINGRSHIKENYGIDYVFNKTHIKAGSLEPVTAGEIQHVVLEIPNDLILRIREVQESTDASNTLYLSLRSFDNASECSRMSNIVILDLTTPLGIPSYFGLRIFLSIVFVALCCLLFNVFRKCRKQKITYTKIDFKTKNTNQICM